MANFGLETEAAMQVNAEAPEDVLQVVISAFGGPDQKIGQVLDALPIAVYITDADGVVIHYNRACVEFAGRRPRVGQDSWCVTWKLYTEEGEYLPHDRCPMAVAIGERRPIRGVSAVAERPDGKYVSFQPYPTPLFDSAGNLIAAINVLAEVTGSIQAHTLREQAAKFRRLVNLWPDRQGAVTSMAAEYDRQALAIEQRH
jgi:PAS domain-containing protein